MTLAELIHRVRQVAQLSDTDADYGDAEILAEATQALHTNFLTTFVNTRSGYFLQRTSVNTVQGQSVYQLPDRAIVNGLEKLEMSTDSGQSYYSPHPLTNFQSTDYENSNTGQPYNFSLESDSVVLYPTPNSPSYILRYFYYIRPSNLVTGVTGGLVQGINLTANTLTVDAPSSNLPAFPWTLDAVHTHGSCELSLVAADYTYSSNVYTFPATVDLSRVKRGDVLRLPDTSDFLQIPVEMHRTLADYTAAVILTSKGDFEKAKPIADKAEKARLKFADLLQPRIKSAQYVFKTRNTFLRRRAGLGRWR